MKRYTKRLVAMAVSVIIFFGALEAVARLLGFNFTLAQWSSSRYISHESMGHIFKPNFRGWTYKKIATGFKKVPVIINSLGLRDDDFPLEKPDGEYRIICLGDSFTFGYLLPVEESYPYQLERLFAGKNRNSHVQVINAGLPAYEISRELALLDELGMQLSPDLVILQFQMMDPYEALDLATRKRTVREKEGRGKEDSAGRRWDRMLNVDATKNLLRFISYEAIRLLDLKRTPRGGLHAERYTLRDKKAWETYREGLAKMAEFTRAKNIPLLVIILPDKIQLYSESDKPQRLLKQYCSELGVPTLDMLPGLKEVRKRRIDIVQDRHYNGFANSIIARELYEYITKHYLEE